MYGFEDMIDMGLRDNEWTSPDHRTVAVNVCICNSNIKTMEDLSNNVEIINSVPKDQIRTITGVQLIALGCYF